jgi:hypothetical protein
LNEILRVVVYLSPLLFGRLYSLADILLYQVLDLSFLLGEVTLRVSK